MAPRSPESSGGTPKRRGLSLVGVLFPCLGLATMVFLACVFRDLDNNLAVRVGGLASREMSSKGGGRHPPPIQKNKNNRNNKNHPEKVVAVIGLESSGTTFVANLLARALGKPSHKEGPMKHATDGDKTYVQHFSLPWGGHCNPERPTPVLQRVVLPGPCDTRFRDLPYCRKMAEEWKIPTKVTPTSKETVLRYPNRFFLDIVSQKEWYESLGIEIVFVIVVREPSVSRNARVRAAHCRNRDLLKREEDFGTGIIHRAIQKYLFDSNNDGSRKLLSAHESWYDEAFRRESTKNGTDSSNIPIIDGDNSSEEHRSSRRRLSLSSLSSGILARNNVVLVSYDSLLALDKIYIKMLYKTLGIKSDYMPEIKDGNRKYIHEIND